MNKHKFTNSIYFLIVYAALTACSNHASGNNNTGIHSEATTVSMSDSMPEQKSELIKIYTQAIAEFIKAVYKKDKTSFDTLYFGKHAYGQPDDFPDIDLPETIENTHVRLVTPEVGQKKQQESKSLVYINMMGWLDDEKADFMLVVFSNGAQHQYDYFINYTYNTSRKEYVMENIEFEDYLHYNGQKPNRISIYKDGKYIFDK